MTEANVVTDNTIKPATGAPAAPEPVVVKIGDKEYKVDPDVAKLLDTERKAAADAKTAAEDAERKAAEAAKKPPVEKPVVPQGDDLETILFTDPKVAIQLIKDEVIAGVRADQAVARAQEGFWTSFYEENPGLKDADIVVKAVMGREFEAMKPMPLAKASGHLAEATQKELLRLGIKREKGKGKPVAEGGNEPGAKGTKKDVSTHQPTSTGLSGILKERAEQRRQSEAGTAN
jgi:hypothetical protein